MERVLCICRPETGEVDWLGREGSLDRRCQPSAFRYKLKYSMFMLNTLTGNEKGRLVLEQRLLSRMAGYSQEPLNTPGQQAE